MTEIYSNIRNEVKEMGEFIWEIALAQQNPVFAAKFLDTATNYCRNLYTEEEIEFLRFYFNMRLEMMK